MGGRRRMAEPTLLTHTHPDEVIALGLKNMLLQASLVKVDSLVGGRPGCALA